MTVNKNSIILKEARIDYGLCSFAKALPDGPL
jgi:hypothetical protein